MSIWLAGCGGGGASEVAAASAPVVLSTPYSGRGWFVDAETGNDAAAGSAGAPWRSLARAATQVLGSGDAVLLKCGGTWHESMTFAAANTPKGGAILGAWGDCTAANRPVVSGADPVAGVAWAAATRFGAKPVFVAAWPHPVSALYWNGQKLDRARYPNNGGIGHEFGSIQVVGDATTFKGTAADATYLAGIDLVGARAFVRTNPWLVEARDVVRSDPSGGVTLSAPTTYTLQPGEGYFLDGKLEFLDAAGEWFYDAAAGRLYVWAPDSSNPSGATLESVQRDVGVTISGAAGNRIDRIAFEKQGRIGLQITDAPNTLVTAVSSRDAGSSGLSIGGTTADKSSGTSVQGSTVQTAGVDGISAASPAVQLVGNDIDSTGTGGADSGVSAGIYLDSVGGTVRGNRLSNSAYAAILLSRATGVVVSGNSIVRACRRFTDCGAIYSGGAPAAAQRTSVTSNAISDMVPNTEGAVGGGEDLVAGIYLDEDSATHDVTHNMISRTRVGINLHNSQDHLLQYNDVWLVDEASIRVHSSLAADSVRGNVIADNALYASHHLIGVSPATTAPAERVVYAQEWVHPSDARLMFGGARPNVVRRNAVNSVTAPAADRWLLISGLQTQALDATQWRAFGTDESSASPMSARPFLVQDGGPNLLQDGSFPLPNIAWSLLSTTAGSGGTLSFGTCPTGGCADFVPSGANDFVVSNVFRMTSTAGDNLYQLSISAQALASDTALTLAVSRASGDFGQLGVVLANQPVASAAPSTVSALFNATGSDPARLGLSGVPGQTVRLRQATIAKVERYELMTPSLESTLLTNETDVAKTVDCPALLLRTCTVSDLSGQRLAWPLTLAPHTAKAVLAADGKWAP